MEGLRFRIAWFMVAVTIAALDFTALRAMVAFPWVRPLVAGGLPTANALGVGLLVARRCPEARPFLLGFEAFGLTALALLAALARSRPSFQGAIRSYLVLGFQPVAEAIGRDRPLVFIPAVAFGMTFMLAGPPATLAVIGGLLSQRLTTALSHGGRRSGSASGVGAGRS